MRKLEKRTRKVCDINLKFLAQADCWDISSLVFIRQNLTYSEVTAMGRNVIDETGNKYGKLSVLKHVIDGDGMQAWLCACDCGNSKIVRGNSLRNGGVKSCGCLYQDRVGPAAPNWKGGIWTTDALKRQVRARDLFCCQLCGIAKKEDGRALHAHHIDYDATHNTLDNLVTLCSHCHQKVHNNRPYWYIYLLGGN